MHIFFLFSGIFQNTIIKNTAYLKKIATGKKYTLEPLKTTANYTVYVLSPIPHILIVPQHLFHPYLYLSCMCVRLWLKFGYTTNPKIVQPVG